MLIAEDYLVSSKIKFKKQSRFHEEGSMSVNSILLSSSEGSKKDAKMPSLISSNCEMTSKYMDDSLSEISALQHYCITLGVGPLWWS